MTSIIIGFSAVIWMLTHFIYECGRFYSDHWEYTELLKLSKKGSESARIRYIEFAAPFKKAHRRYHFNLIVGSTFTVVAVFVLFMI